MVRAARFGVTSEARQRVTTPGPRTRRRSWTAG